LTSRLSWIALAEGGLKIGDVEEAAFQVTVKPPLVLALRPFGTHALNEASLGMVFIGRPPRLGLEV
jgi:hypothetical protein